MSKPVYYCPDYNHTEHLSDPKIVTHFNMHVSYMKKPTPPNGIDIADDSIAFVASKLAQPSMNDATKQWEPSVLLDEWNNHPITVPWRCSASFDIEGNGFQRNVPLFVRWINTFRAANPHSQLGVFYGSEIYSDGENYDGPIYQQWVNGLPLEAEQAMYRRVEYALPITRLSDWVDAECYVDPVWFDLSIEAAAAKVKWMRRVTGKPVRLRIMPTFPNPADPNNPIPITGDRLRTYINRCRAIGDDLLIWGCTWEQYVKDIRGLL